MKPDIKKLLTNLALPLAVGALAALLSRGGMAAYAQMAKPPLSPPGWVFPVVWTALYLLMGWAAYRVWTSGGEPAAVKNAMILYGIQLFLNFLWPIVFFRWQAPLAALLVLAALWVVLFLTIRAFSRLDETAGNLLLPYLLWVTFAGYLNYGAFLLN